MFAEVVESIGFEKEFARHCVIVKEKLDMFRLGSSNRPVAPWSPGEVTVKKAVILVIKQIVFLLVVGFVLWGVQALTHSPAFAHTSHPPTKIEQSEETQTKIQTPSASETVLQGHNPSTRSKP